MEYLWCECVYIKVIFGNGANSANFMIWASAWYIFEFYSIYNSICAGYNYRPRSMDRKQVK